MDPATSRSPDPADLLRAALGGDERPVPWTAPAIAELAATFPDLTLHELVGQGGMAAVYRATQTRLGRPVALKVMRSDLASQPQFVERFVREARALAALSNPHVLAIHDFGERGGVCYLVTEFVDGANLRELMQLGRLSPAEVLRIVPQICAGLHFAHQHGVVHRDIKPENVLVDREGVVKLADFGLAKLAGDPGHPGLTGSGMVFGTPHYMAPEQWHGSAGVDHRADIYSLGVVLYELLTGRLPVGTYAPASQQPGVPRGIDQVVQRSLQQEPERRYQSARDVQSDLERQGRGMPGTVATPLHSARGWLLASAAVLLLGSAALLMFWQRESWVEVEQFFIANQVARTERVMVEVRATVDSGKPWLGAVPEAPMPVTDMVLPTVVRNGLLLVGGAAVIALVLLLAVAARQRLGFASASRAQYVVANLLLWSPVLVPAFVWLVIVAARYSQATNGLLTFPALLTIFLVLFFAVRALWSAAGRRPVGEPRPLGAGARVAMALGAVLLVGCVAVAVWAPRQGSPVRIVRTPIAARQLVGMTREQVLERLGPPRSITASANSMTWSYRGLDGADRPNLLMLTGDRVSAVDLSDVPVLPEGTPPMGPYLGQLLADVLAQMGPATQSTVGAHGTQLQFADGTTIHVGADGVVVGVTH